MNLDYSQPFWSGRKEWEGELRRKGMVNQERRPRRDR
jgi:hypothetical protein